MIFQTLVANLSENARDHKEYNDAFYAATKWLADMEERVQECNDTAGDWHTLQDRMDAIKVKLYWFNYLIILNHGPVFIMSGKQVEG